MRPDEFLPAARAARAEAKARAARLPVQERDQLDAACADAERTFYDRLVPTLGLHPDWTNPARRLPLDERRAAFALAMVAAADRRMQARCVHTLSRNAAPRPLMLDLTTGTLSCRDCLPEPLLPPSRAGTTMGTATSATRPAEPSIRTRWSPGRSRSRRTCVRAVTRSARANPRHGPTAREASLPPRSAPRVLAGESARHGAGTAVDDGLRLESHTDPRPPRARRLTTPMRRSSPAARHTSLTTARVPNPFRDSAQQPCHSPSREHFNDTQQPSCPA